MRRNDAGEVTAREAIAGRAESHAPAQAPRPRYQPLPFDYEAAPGRWQATTRSKRHLTRGNVHPVVAQRFASEGVTRVLDLGCARGEMRWHLPETVAVVGLDRSARQLADGERPAVLADAVALPFRDATFDAVSALWMLYHLADPSVALGEAHRVLRPGGLFAACTFSRDDSPELAFAEVRPPTTFDAEEAEQIVGRVFTVIDTVRWDAPLVRLPDELAVQEYLVGRRMPPSRARTVAALVETPLSVTKRGILVYGQKR